MKRNLLIAFFLIMNLCTMQARYGRLMMFVDQGEPREYERIDISVVMACIQALYEKTGPILVNAYVWNNILGRYQAYANKLKLPTSSAMKYYELCQTAADYVKKELANVSDKNKNDLNALEVALQRMVTYNLAMNADFQKKYKDFYTEKDVWMTIANGTIYRVINELDFSQWHIYTIDDAWYLFVPRHYQQNMEKGYNAEVAALFPTFKRSIPSAHDALTDRDLEKDEIALGLKLHNFEKIVLLHWKYFFLAHPVFEFKEGVLITSKNIEDLLKRLFVTYDDMQDKTIASAILPHYTIYLDGHGGYASDMDMEWLAEALAESSQLQKDIGFFSQGQMSDFPKEKREKITRLMVLEKEITTMINDSQGIIAGLSMTAYKQLLDFLNDKISTTMLYYYSCFGGGKHLQLPFVSRGVDKAYNYTIMSEVSGDIPGYGAVSFFGNAKVQVFYENNEARARLGLTSEINFSQFFDAVEKKLPLNVLMSSIVHNQKTNIPAVRLPGTSWFSAARLKDVAYLTNVALSTTKKFDVSGKKAVLLYTPAISSVITLNVTTISQENPLATAQYQASNQLPLFISMIPEQQTHWMQSLQACDCLLTAVVYNFLKELVVGEIRVFKKYLIDVMCVQNNLSKKASDLLGVDQNQMMMLTDVIIYNGHMPKLRLRQGLLFTWMGKGYMAKYILLNGEKKFESINPEQEIEELTPDQFEYYQKMYQIQKSGAQKIAKPLIDTSTLEQFTRKHKKKPVFGGRDIFAPEIEEKPAFGGRDIFAPENEEDEPSE